MSPIARVVEPSFSSITIAAASTPASAVRTYARAPVVPLLQLQQRAHQPHPHLLQLPADLVAQQQQQQQQQQRALEEELARIAAEMEAGQVTEADWGKCE